MYPKIKSSNLKRTQQSGFTLIEVLVASIILGVGIIGMAGLQLQSLNTSRGSFSRTQAILYSDYIIDLMQANLNAVSGGSYDDVDTADTISNPPDCITNSCTQNQLAAFNINNWKTMIENSNLVDGRGTVTRSNTDGTYTIALSWEEKNWESAITPGNDLITKSYVISGLIFNGATIANN